MPHQLLQKLKLVKGVYTLFPTYFWSKVDVIEGIVEQVNEGMEEEGAESTDLAPSMELRALQLSIEHSTSNHEVRSL